MSRLHADIALLFAAAIWGVAFIFQKSAMADIGPLAFIACRGAVAALALAPLALREGARPGAKLASSGFWSLASDTALYVVITPFIAWTWNRIRPSPAVWPAVILSAVGTWLLGGGALAAFSDGDKLVALSAFFWALHVVVTGRASPFRRPIAYTAVQFAVVSALGAIFSFGLESTSLDGLIAAAPEIAYVGLLSSALTFTLLTVALQYTPPAEAAVIVSLETVFAAAAAYWLLGERLDLIGWSGAALIMCAVLVLQIGTARAARK
jgi:drug/metabolite transporter (DMT)-like permease